MIQARPKHIQLDKLSDEQIKSKNIAALFLMLYSVNSSENWDISSHESYLQKINDISSRFEISDKLREDTALNAKKQEYITENPNYLMILDMMHAMTGRDPNIVDFSENGKKRLLHAIEEFTESI